MRKQKSVLFTILAGLTVLYSGIQVAIFHWHIMDAPKDFNFFGTVVLVCCYVTSEVISWRSSSESAHKKDFFLVPAVAVYLYMRIMSLYLKSHYQLAGYPDLPSGVFDSAVEAIVLWSLSICSFWVRHHRRRVHHVHHGHGQGHGVAPLLK